MSSATVSATPGRSTVGQSVLLTITIHDDSGALADPATCGVKLLLADQTTTSLTIADLTHVSTGLYTYPYTGTVPGEVQTTVTTTVPNATATTSFTLDPSATGRLTSGYLTVAEFRAMPTRLAVDQLVVDASARMQDAELAAVLSRSSQWADTYCQTQIGAHAVTLLQQVRADRNGDVHISARVSPKFPVIVTGVSWGASRTALTALTDLTATYVDNGLVTVGLGSYSGSWTGALQIGIPPLGRAFWVSLDLLIGWPNTVLAADQNPGDTTITVLDPTDISAGSVLQLTNPGVEETVTVDSITGSTVTLTSGLLNGQTTGCGTTAIPSDVREAVAYAACARIVTPGVQTSPVPGASLKGPKTVQTAEGQYQAQAQDLLSTYRRRLP